VRYLGIDLGGKRTGLALGDDETGIASAYKVIEEPLEPGDRLFEALRRVVEQEKPDALVFGLPLNMEDGSEGDAAKRVRAFAARVDAACGGVGILFHDERLTSAEADWSMSGSGLTHKQKKARRDAVAAAGMLRGFLEEAARRRQDAAE